MLTIHFHVKQTMKVRPTNSRVQRIHLLRFPMTASWIHRTLWQSSLTSTPPEVGDPSWITKLMVGESICGSLSLLSYLWDLCIVMAFSISPLRLGCYRFVVAILKLCTFLGTLLGHFLYTCKDLRFRVLKGLLRSRPWVNLQNQKRAQTVFYYYLKNWGLLSIPDGCDAGEFTRYLRCLKTIHEGS